MASDSWSLGFCMFFCQESDPIQGETYEKMVLPVLSHVGNCIQVAGLGCPNLLLEYTNCWPQVYPEGNQSNNNQFLASATGTISAIDGLKVPRLHSWHPGWRGVPILISFTVQ